MTDAARRTKRKKVRFTEAQKKADGEGLLNGHWRSYFLEHLAATSNVTAAAQHAGASVNRAYKTRREHPDFAAQWRAALQEGYEHLEMEVLAYLRGTLTDRKIDVANAIRQLAAHSKSIAEMRAIDAEEDEDVIRAQIDALIEKFRAEAKARQSVEALPPPPGDTQ